MSSKLNSRTAKVLVIMAALSVLAVLVFASLAIAAAGVGGTFGLSWLDYSYLAILYFEMFVLCVVLAAWVEMASNYLWKRRLLRSADKYIRELNER